MGCAKGQWRCHNQELVVVGTCGWCWAELRQGQAYTLSVVDSYSCTAACGVRAHTTLDAEFQGEQLVHNVVVVPHELTA